MADQEVVTVREFDGLKEALDARLDELRAMIADGFKGVHHRQDIANGRVNKHAEELARHGVQIEGAAKRVEDIATNGCAMACGGPTTRRWKPTATQAAIGGAVGGGGLLAVVPKVLEFLKQIL